MYVHTSVQRLHFVDVYHNQLDSHNQQGDAGSALPWKPRMLLYRAHVYEKLKRPKRRAGCGRRAVVDRTGSPPRGLDEDYRLG
jgi:hypothetical protein